MHDDDSGPGTGAGPHPTPWLGPAEVVAVQLDALRSEPGGPRDGGTPGPGLRTAWAFASPANQAATGPLERFARMLRGSVYGGLLGHRAVQLGPVVESGDEARLEVLVLTADDRTVGFTWVLGRQERPPHAGCWLTDGVLRHPDRSPDRHPDLDPDEGER